jgi:phage terminase large subunit GpA-like protein
LETAQKGEKRHITIQKAAQAGMTLACYIVVLHKICNDQVPCGITMPSVDQARKKAEKVFIPMIEDSPVIAAQKPDNPDDFKKLEQQMRGMTVTWLGTNNASQLASDTFGMLLIDEPDKYPHVLAGESTPLMLLMERTTTLWNHLVLLPCTPTTERGVVHKEWQKGDRREYYVPCIYCNEMQVIRWQAFKFDSTLPIEEHIADRRSRTGRIYRMHLLQRQDQRPRKKRNAGRWRMASDVRSRNIRPGELPFSALVEYLGIGQPVQHRASVFAGQRQAERIARLDTEHIGRTVYRRKD